MKKYLELVWIILAALTLFAFLLGYLKIISTFFVAVLLLSTFIKGQLVIDYFMGLKNISWKYRIIPTLWLGIIISLIAVAYYLPIAPSQ